MTYGLLSALTLLGSLEVISASPDAMCPTVRAAEEAIQARVGSLEGSQYQLRYELMRSTADGPETLRLELRENGETLLLARDISLGTEGCPEAAQAIALVLERYFERLDRTGETPVGEPVDGTKPEEPAAAATAVAAAEVKQEPPASASHKEPTAATKRSGPSASKAAAWQFRASGAINEEIEPEIGLGTGYRGARVWSLLLDARFPLLPQKESGGSYEVSSRRLGLYPGVRLWTEFSGWRFGAGPMVPLELEWASSNGLEESGSAFRVIAGLGASGFASYSVSPALALELSVRGGGLFTGATKDFQVGVLDAEPLVVLARNPFTLGVDLTIVWEPSAN